MQKEQMSIRLNKEDKKSLAHVAKFWGLSVTAFIRMMIKREWRKIQ